MDNDNVFDFELNETENYWTVSQYNGGDEEVTVPAFHEGKPVKALGTHAFAFRKRLKHVIIPEGIISFGNMHFRDAQNLRTSNSRKASLPSENMRFRAVQDLQLSNSRKILFSLEIRCS